MTKTTAIDDERVTSARRQSQRLRVEIGHLKEIVRDLDLVDLSTDGLRAAIAELRRHAEYFDDESTRQILALFDGR